MSDDKVNPQHYKIGGLEVAEILRAKLTPEEYKGCLKANILKYIFRYPYKNGVEDLKKAQWYLAELVREESE